MIKNRNMKNPFGSHALLAQRARKFNQSAN
jgi:hypothetical protein